MGVRFGLVSGLISTPLATAMRSKVFCTKNSMTIRIKNTNAKAPKIILLLTPEDPDWPGAAPGTVAEATGAGGI